jgi:hypothetical protein
MGSALTLHPVWRKCHYLNLFFLVFIVNILIMNMNFFTCKNSLICSVAESNINAEIWTGISYETKIKSMTGAGDAD